MKQFIHGFYHPKSLLDLIANPFCFFFFSWLFVVAINSYGIKYRFADELYGPAVLLFFILLFAGLTSTVVVIFNYISHKFKKEN